MGSAFMVRTSADWTACAAAASSRDTLKATTIEVSPARVLDVIDRRPGIFDRFCSIGVVTDRAISSTPAAGSVVVIQNVAD